MNPGMNHKEIERWYRRKNLKTVVQVLIVLSVAGLAIGYGVSRFLNSPPDDFPAAPVTRGAITVEGFSYSVPGAHPWELRAESAVVTEGLESVTLTKPRVVYHGGQGSPIALRADTATLDRNQKNVTARGDVQIEYGDFLFAAGEIHYWQDKLIVETQSEVSLKGNDLTVTGKGLTLSIEKEEITIQNDVKARLLNIKWVEPNGRLPM